MSTKATFLASLLLALAGLAMAEDRQPPASWVEAETRSVSALPTAEFAPLDAQALRKADAATGKIGEAVQFAVPAPVSISPTRHGHWETLSDGSRIWRKRFDFPGATDINFGFSRFWLPAGATVHIYDAERSFFQGPWDASSNRPHGQFWTPVVPGDSAVLELRIPAGVTARPIMELHQVAGGYRDWFGHYDGPHLHNHGSCNIDVECEEGDDWRDQIRSVGVYQRSGVWACTGSLVNDVPQSLTPFFLTAHHCGVTAASAPSMVVYWNYQTPACGSGSGSLAQNQTGATLAATRSDVDMTLVVLDDEPDEAFDVHFSGWDRSNSQPGGAVAIHQPRTHHKSISFAFSDLGTTPSCIGGGTPNTHWDVPFWNQGTTEPGSSGSGIWNPQNGRLIGFLSGGLAACGNQEFDCYGKFAVAWDGASAATRLSDHLDPQGLEPAGIDGTDPDTFQLEPAASQWSQCGFDDLDIAVDVTSAGGFDDPVTLSTSGLPGGVNPSFSVNPVIPPGSSDLTLENLVAAGTGTFTFALEGDGGGQQRSLDISLSLHDDLPGTAEISSPTNGAVGVSITPLIEWVATEQAFQYQLEIATDAGFAEVVHSAVTFGTSHEVDSPLDTNSTYYLRVRALNDCGDGQWSEVVSFSTEALPGDCPVGTQTQSLFHEDFAAGSIPSGWSTAGSSGAVTWVASSNQSHAGGHSMFAQNIATVSDQRLTSPEVSLPAGVASLFLNFQNWQHIESGGSGCFDGGVLEISSNDGATWTQVGNEHILVRDYDGPIDPRFANPLSDQQAWCGDPRTFWERYAVDLSAWEGQEARFRFRFGTDNSVSRVGWYVDSVEVRACLQGDPVTIGGTVEGLEGAGLVLQNNGADDLPIENNGEFTFVSTLFPDQSYLVTVSEQPIDPAQECSVDNAQGDVGEEDVTDVLVSCQTLGVLDADPGELDFGEVPEGGEASQNVTISNVAPAGAMDLEISVLEIIGDAEFQIVGGDCQVGSVLAAGASCQVEVQFGPNTAASFTGTVNAQTSDGQAVEVELAGEGIELDPGEPEVSPQSLAFGPVPTNLEATLTVTVSNLAPAGSADLVISQTSVISGQAVFGVDAEQSDCGPTLAPQASCSVVVRYSPIEETTSSGVLRLVIDGANHNVSLSGTGTEPETMIFHDDFVAGGS